MSKNQTSSKSTSAPLTNGGNRASSAVSSSSSQRNNEQVFDFSSVTAKASSQAIHLQELSFGDFAKDELNIYLNSKSLISSKSDASTPSLDSRRRQQQQEACAGDNEEENEEIRQLLGSNRASTTSSSDTQASGSSVASSSVLTSPSSVASSTSDLNNNFCCKAPAAHNSSSSSSSSTSTTCHGCCLNGVKFPKHLDLKAVANRVDCSPLAAFDTGSALDFEIEFGFNLNERLAASIGAQASDKHNSSNNSSEDKRSAAAAHSKEEFTDIATIVYRTKSSKSSSSSSSSSSFSSSNPLASPNCSYSSDESSESQHIQRFSIDKNSQPPHPLPHHHHHHIHKQSSHKSPTSTTTTTTTTATVTTTTTIPNSLYKSDNINKPATQSEEPFDHSKMQTLSASSKDNILNSTSSNSTKSAISYSSAVAASISSNSNANSSRGSSQQETISLTQSETVIHTIKLNGVATGKKKQTTTTTPVHQQNGSHQELEMISHAVEASGSNSRSSNSSTSSNGEFVVNGSESGKPSLTNGDANGESQRRNKKRKPPNYYQDNPEIAAIIKLSDQPASAANSQPNAASDSEKAAHLENVKTETVGVAQAAAASSDPATTTSTKTTSNETPNPAKTVTSTSTASSQPNATKPVSTTSQQPPAAPQPISWAAVANSSNQPSSSSQTKSAPPPPTPSAPQATPVVTVVSNAVKPAADAAEIPVITHQIEKLTIKIDEPKPSDEPTSQAAPPSASPSPISSSTTTPVPAATNPVPPASNTTTTTSSTTITSTQSAPLASAWGASSGPKAWSSLFVGSVKASESSESPSAPPAQNNSNSQNVSSQSKSKPSTPKLISPAASSTQTPQTNGPSTAPSTDQQQQQAGSGDVLKLLGAAFKQYELKHSAPALQPRGLRNKQNWCYVNATLQALLACPPFYNLMKTIFAKIKSSNVSTKSVPCLTSLGRFVNESKTIWRPAHESGKAATFNGKEITIGDPFEIDYFYETLGNLRASAELNFKTGRQEDAQEFLSLLLNRLHDEMVNCLESLNPSPTTPAANSNDTTKLNGGGSANGYGVQSYSLFHDDVSEAANDDDDEWKEVGKKNRAYITRKTEFKQSPLSDIFCGQFRSTLSQHGSKEKESISLEPFFTLPLDIQSDSIRNLDSALEHLVKKEELFGFTNPETKQEIEAFKQISFEDLPPVLILYLKCFVYDKHGGIQKLNKRIDFNIDLEISKELISPNQRSKLREKKRSYKLFAVEYHLGDIASGGHYITDVYHPGIIAWVRFDDSNVKIIPTNQVLKGDDKKLIPYLLYYRRADLITSSS